LFGSGSTQEKRIVEPHLSHSGSVFEIPWVIRGMPAPVNKY
jgi:hypothetical protein